MRGEKCNGDFTGNLSVQKVGRAVRGCGGGRFMLCLRSICKGKCGEIRAQANVITITSWAKGPVPLMLDCDELI